MCLGRQPDLLNKRSLSSIQRSFVGNCELRGPFNWSRLLLRERVRIWETGRHSWLLTNYTRNPLFRVVWVKLIPTKSSQSQETLHSKTPQSIPETTPT